MESNYSNGGFLEKLKIKKKPQPITDLTELYGQIAKESIYYSRLEDRKEYSNAIQGWKSLTTDTLFRLSEIERAFPNSEYYTKDELSLKNGIWELYHKAMINLDRVQELNTSSASGAIGNGTANVQLTADIEEQRKTNNNSPPKISNPSNFRIVNSLGSRSQSNSLTRTMQLLQGNQTVGAATDETGVMTQSRKFPGSLRSYEQQQNQSSSLRKNKKTNSVDSTSTEAIHHARAAFNIPIYHEIPRQKHNLTMHSDTTLSQNSFANFSDNYENTRNSYNDNIPQHRTAKLKEHRSTNNAPILENQISSLDLNSGSSPKKVRRRELQQHQQNNYQVPPTPMYSNNDSIGSKGSLSSKSSSYHNGQKSRPNRANRPHSKSQSEPLTYYDTNENASTLKPYYTTVPKNYKTSSNSLSSSSYASQARQLKKKYPKGYSLENSRSHSKESSNLRKVRSHTKSNSSLNSSGNSQSQNIPTPPDSDPSTPTAMIQNNEDSPIKRTTKKSASNPKDDWEDEVIASIPGIDKQAAKQIFSEIVVHGDEVFWDDVAGLKAAKNSLKEAVVYPFLRPDLFKGLREPVRGMLLFGPPGTGKTMLARAVATESKSTFFSISASSLTSKYLGESEKLVRALFAIAKKLSPSIVFVDEIDSIMGSREDSGENEASRRIKNEFLVQWSSLSNAAAGKSEDDERVLVLAATNLPWAIDDAARRRFVRRQYIPLPEGKTRKAQFQNLLKYQIHNLDEDDLHVLVKLTKGFSGSDITSLAKDAAMGPLRELGESLLDIPTSNIRPVELYDFKNSLEYIKPSVSQRGLRKYEKWAEEFGSSGV